MDINVSRGILDNKNLAGNVQVDALKSQYSGVSLKAQGDIKQTIKGTTITGQNIKLEISELRVKANETDKEKSARLAKLSILANVEAADVTVHYVLDENGKPVTQTIERVNYNYDADGKLFKYTYDKDLKQVGDAVAVNSRRQLRNRHASQTVDGDIDGRLIGRAEQ